LWAAALNNYGYALTALAEREDSGAPVSLLEEAIDILEESLDVYSPHRHPRGWETVQTNLNKAKQRLRERIRASEYSNGEALLSECIAGASSPDDKVANDSTHQPPRCNN
jgi:hypothetical protein